MSSTLVLALSQFFFLVISSNLHMLKVGGICQDSKTVFVFVLGPQKVCLVKFRRFQILVIKVKI